MSLADDTAAWEEIERVEWQSLSHILSCWKRISSKPEVLTRALQTPGPRGAALRFLLVFQDDDLREQVFPTLVDQASVGHSDIGLCRWVIKTMPRRWVIEHIEPIGLDILKRTDGEEEYRRLGELYLELDDRLAERLLKLELSHPNEEIREAGADLQRHLH